MSLLKQVTKGKIKQPILAILYGSDGVGKSTFGAESPSPIFLGTEKGTANLDVARFPTPSSFKMVLQAIEDLTKESHTYQTLVIDSLDWLEPLVWEQVCFDHNAKGIEDLGYGKGYVYANKYWMDLMAMLTKLREQKKMNIILIAHAQVKLAKDPQAQAEYDRYQLKLNEKAAALWREYVDCVLFANFETLVKSDKGGKTKAFGEGDRYIFTERRPGFDAKNRFGLPFQMELSWEEFYTAIQHSSEDSLETLLGNVSEYVKMLEDEALKATVQKKVDEAKGDRNQLERIMSRLRDLVTV